MVTDEQGILQEMSPRTKGQEEGTSKLWELA